MERNVVGLFDSRDDALEALQELRSAGFSADDVSFIASNARGEYERIEDEGGIFDKEGDGLDAKEGAAFGAASGAVMGGIAGLLAGLGALAIPGIGPAIAGGAIASALAGTAVGAGAGAIAGGIIGALVGAGIPEEEAHIYAESLRRGGSLIIVRAESEAAIDRAIDIMNRHNVVDIDQRAEEYRSTGWTRFDEEAAPYAGISSTGYAAPEITGYAPDRGLTGTPPEGTPRAGGYARVYPYPSERERGERRNRD